MPGRLENIDAPTDDRDACGFDRLLFDFTDKCFEGNTQKLNLLTNIENFMESPTNQTSLVKGNWFLFHLKNTSYDYHKYLETAAIYDGLSLAFTEPNFSYSNIKGGYGLFAIYNEAIIKIPIQ